MTSDRSNRVSDIFEQATAFEGADRERFLAEVCGDDADLRHELESLLEHDKAAAPDFMRAPEAWATARAADDERVGPDPLIGQRIGGCRVRSVLATGGMGTVYLAEQEAPHRDVAVKLMRWRNGARHPARRFESESQILAPLRHPNIAQVYAAGTHRDEHDHGRTYPYFVMEYVPEALPITAHVEKRDLSIRDRLKLFLQLCDAVHHGHQKGVIHRDIKPANVLVETGGRVKVIDFGVARATDSDLALATLQTDVGQLVGTVQYMSPEQWDADPHAIDTRSDVYSLGVVLYELLCGRPPYELDGTPIHRAGRVVQECVPKSPGVLDRALRGDLETVVMKALEKHPAHRYQSAAELGDDVRRYLRREPVEARLSTAWVRAYRWVARHPVFATALVCAVVGLLTAGSTAWLVTWLSLHRPEKVDLSPDRSAARLLSVTGKELHSWPAGAPSGVPWASRVRQAEAFGGRDLAVVGFSSLSENKGLCLFDIGGDRSTPLRRLLVRDEDLPKDQLKKERLGRDYGVSDGMVADFFPGDEHPGPEILAIFASLYSQRCIRIYNTDGFLLYQAWHEGTIQSFYWMSSERLLVFSGEDARQYRTEFGLEPLDGWGKYPFVVYALRPRPESVHAEFIDSGDAGNADNPLAPAWYQFFLPPHSHELAPGLLHAPHSAPEHASYVSLDFEHHSGERPGGTLILDASGRLAMRSRWVRTDAYTESLNSAPPSSAPPKFDQIELGSRGEFLARCAELRKEAAGDDRERIGE